MKHYLIHLIVALVLAACSSQPKAQDTPLVITPGSPQAGEVLTITYNPNHRKAKFPDSAPYFATFHVIQQTECNVYRILLHPEDSCYTGTYTVPDDALYIYVLVGPENVDQYAESRSSMVYDGEYPVRHAIPLLREVSTYEEACEACALDEYLYPDCTDRYLALWVYRIRAGVETKGLREEVDSVLSSVARRTMETGTPHNMNEFNALTGALYVYTMLGDYEKAGHLSRMLLESARWNKKCPPMASWNLSSIWGRMMSDMAPGKSGREDLILPAMGNLIDIALVTRNDRLLDEIVQLDRSPNINLWSAVPAVRELVHSERYWPRIKAMTLSVKGDDIIEYGQFIIHMSMAMLAKGEYQACIAHAGRHIPGLDTLSLWIRTDETLPVNNFSTPGYEAMVNYDRIQAYKALRNDSAAIELMRGAARRKYRVEYAWIVGRSNVELAKRFAVMGERDSAELYLSWALQMHVYDGKKVYAFVKKELGNALPEPDALRKKYFREDYARTIPCPVTLIETERTTYRLGKNFRGPLLLLFSSRTCGICQTAIPRMVRDIQKNYKKPPKIIIATDEGKDYYTDILKDCSRMDIEYAWFDPGVLMKFQQSAVPAFALIKNGKMIASGPVGTMTWKALTVLEKD